MSALVVSGRQFVSTGYHSLCVPVTIGLAFSIALLSTWSRHHEMATTPPTRLASLLLIAVAITAVTGLPLDTLWRTSLQLRRGKHGAAPLWRRTLAPEREWGRS